MLDLVNAFNKCFQCDSNKIHKLISKVNGRIKIRAQCLKCKLVMAITADTECIQEPESIAFVRIIIRKKGGE
jgi:hypothetical protein